MRNCVLRLTLLVWRDRFRGTAPERNPGAVFLVNTAPLS
jgi:hypothetical protein